MKRWRTVHIQLAIAAIFLLLLPLAGLILRVWAFFDPAGAAAFIEGMTG